MTGVRSPQHRGNSSEEGGESRKERIDRELMELLNELRVALPGVQFLFAFLLVVPFSSRATSSPTSSATSTSRRCWPPPWRPGC